MKVERAADSAVGFGLAVGVVGAAVVLFPVALAFGAGLYVALHHTPSGRASMALLDTLAADEPEETAA